MTREQGTGNRLQGTGNREQEIGNREQGIGYREQGIGYREQGIGYREQVTGKRLRRERQPNGFGQLYFSLLVLVFSVYLITWPQFYRINKLYFFLDENFLNSTFDSTFYEFGESHALV
ncbi:MAG: hypothetical protein RLZZ184_3761 [Cyanobacteriota bacterium]|jgi:hypothetical protein